MKNNYKLLFIISFITCICFVFLLFWISLKSSSFNMKFYHKEYVNLNIYKKTNIIEKDYNNNLNILLEYIQGKKSDININNKEIFNTKEKRHMEDVKTLYITGEKIFYIFLFISIIGFSFLIIVKKDIIKILTSSFTFITGIIFIFLIITIIKLNSNFLIFWNNFHKLIFTNNLWLLNLSDTLIKMFPSELFKNLVQIIIIRFIISISIIEIILLIFYYKKKFLNVLKKLKIKNIK